MCGFANVWVETYDEKYITTIQSHLCGDEAYQQIDRMYTGKFDRPLTIAKTEEQATTDEKNNWLEN